MLNYATGDGFSFTPTSTQLLIALPLLLGLVCTATWLSTTLRFHYTVVGSKLQSQKPTAPSPPLTLPYALPWLGSALSFLNQNPGSFWRYLSQRVLGPSDLTAITILLGGNKTHVVTSAHAIQGLFKTRNVSRDRFNRQIAQNALGASKDDTERMFPHETGKSERHEKDEMDVLNHDFLLSQTAVNSLTGKFIEVFQQALHADEDLVDWRTVDLVDWLKHRMFTASVTALMGSKILEMNPKLAEQYWEFDATLLTRFYGVPRMLQPRAYQVLDDMLEETQLWVEYVLAECRGNPPLAPEWEPLFGAKVMRARHQFYIREGLSVQGKASFDLGFLFGLSSNAIPATGWLLTHLLSPTTPADVLPRIMAELKMTQRGDGIDIPTLLSLPLLNSAFYETLRLYVDVLITRELKTNLTLDRHLLQKNDLVMAPSYLGHHDQTFWREPGVHVWYAERFLKHDSSTGKDVFSTSWAAGKFFPFGGGPHICPGRVFAKQEVLAAVATFLLTCELEVVEFVGEDGQGKGRGGAGFPKVKRQYAGNGVVSMSGDVRVRVRRKSQ